MKLNPKFVKYSKYVPYLGLSLLIFAPLLADGFILTLDMVFSDKAYSNIPLTSNFLFFQLLSVAGNLIPIHVIQKFILLTIVIACGVGAHKLIEQILQSNKTGATYIINLFAGFFYAVNPFTYSHFMAGQYLILLGYACIPFFLSALLKFLKKVSWKAGVNLCVWLTLVGIFSIHILGMLILLVIPFLILYVYRNRREKMWCKRIILRGVALMGGFVVVNCYWLLPILNGQSKIVETVGSFSPDDFRAFATGGEGFGVLGNLIMMRGFWGDQANLYLTPDDIYGWWFLPYIFLTAMIILGIIYGLRRKRGLSIALIVIYFLALILASGTVGSPFASLNTILIDHITFFSGYREPQKFVALIVLVYTIFASFGLRYFIDRVFSTRFASMVNRYAIIVVLLPLLIAPLSIWGFNGQLHVSRYPNDWYVMDKYLEQNSSGRVLALPWHMYMRFDFAGRIIFNPMERFFSTSIIVNKDPEFKGAKSYSTTIENELIGQTLKNKVDLSKKLSQQGIKYILVAKEFDYKDYAYLEGEKGVVLMRDTETLKLYKLEPDTIE